MKKERSKEDLKTIEKFTKKNIISKKYKKIFDKMLNMYLTEEKTSYKETLDGNLTSSSRKMFERRIRKIFDLIDELSEKNADKLNEQFCLDYGLQFPEETCLEYLLYEILLEGIYFSE